MSSAVIIYPEGDSYVVGHPSDEEQQYRCVCMGVGQYGPRTLVERVVTRIDGHTVEVWVDEEGLLKSLPYNGKASRFASPSMDWPLVGIAYVTGPDMTPLPDDVKDAVLARLA